MTVDDLLTEARAGLTRVDAPTAAAEQRAGALLVDTRPAPSAASKVTCPVPW